VEEEQEIIHLLAQVEVVEEAINPLDETVEDTEVKGTQSVLVRETFFRVGYTRCPPWSAGQLAELRGP
jgi:hypothetical protein